MRFCKIRTPFFQILGFAFLMNFAACTSPKAEPEDAVKEEAMNEGDADLGMNQDLNENMQGKDSESEDFGNDDFSDENQDLGNENMLGDQAINEKDQKQFDQDVGNNMMSQDGQAALPPPVAYNPSERVVRYVRMDNTPAFEGPNESSKKVATYHAGDPLVVKVEKDWAQISDKLFIRSSALSEKIVPHKRNSGWEVKGNGKVSKR